MNVFIVGNNGFDHWAIVVPVLTILLVVVVVISWRKRSINVIGVEPVTPPPITSANINVRAESGTMDEFTDLEKGNRANWRKYLVKSEDKLPPSYLCDVD